MRNWGPRFATEEETTAEPKQQQYQGKDIQSVRDARKGDPGFVEGQDLVVIVTADGDERTVKRSEVK